MRVAGDARVTVVAVDDAERGGGRRARPGRAGSGRGAGEERLAVLQRPAVEQVAPGGEDEAARPRALGTSPALDRRGRGARARPRAERGHLGADLAQRAGAEELAHLVGEHVEHAVVADVAGLEGRLEGARRGPPSRRTCRPSRRAAATGRTTSATRGDRRRRGSRGRRRTVGSRASAAPARPRSAGSTPPTTRAPSSPVAAAARMPAVSRPGVVGQADDAPGRGDLGAGRGVGDRAAAGQQGRAARRPRGHRAHRPDAGTQARRAPVAAARRGGGASGRRGRSRGARRRG